MPLPGQGMGSLATSPEQLMGAFGASGTLHAIVTRCATATAAAEWKLWRSSASGKDEDRVQVTKHLALDIWNKPNPFMTGRQFRETFQQHLDLVGEGWWTISYDERMKSIPLEMWPVRPDRMEPVPDPELFIKGYEYLSPDGERVPLSVDEVVFLRMPNPLDLYRGMGPVQAIMTQIDSARYSAEWNRSFFRNSAQPGGIIEYEEELGDTEYQQIVERWREQHQGVGNAHRVAIIERGKWVDRSTSQRDMQFVELWDVSRETIREAFAFPKPLLGAVDDVNRANAEAAEVVFARWLVKDRLERIKQALNADFLPKFGTTGKGLEFDYENPVPEDREADARDLGAKAAALKIFVDLGAVFDSACEALDLPEMDYEKPPPPPPPTPTFGAPPATPGQGAAAPKVGTKPKALAYAWDAVAREDAHERPDLTRVQVAWEKALASLLTSWKPVRADQVDALVRQISEAITEGDLSALTRLRAPADDGTKLLTKAMVDVARGAGEHVVREAKAQGVDIQPAVPIAATLADSAALVVELNAAALSLTAGREALRVRRSAGNAMNAAPMSVEEHMRAFLAGMSDHSLAADMGAALTQAQNAGRFETLLSGPTAALYASEQMDKSTCEPCSEIDGRWLGNSDGVDMATLNKTYPNSGYVGCLGRDRCRGTVVGTWRKGTG